MTKKYSEMRNYILSCYDFDSLDEVASTAFDAYYAGTLTDEEYANLQKLMNCIVKKGVECINSWYVSERIWIWGTLGINNIEKRIGWCVII